MSTELTRAQLLCSAGRGSAALVIAGTAIGTFAATADATPPSYAIGLLPAGDLAHARLLIAGELLAIDFYTHALASGHLDRGAGDDARLALANEQAHYTYLAGVITTAGQKPITAADIDFTYPASAFYTAASVTKLAATIEALALGSYLGAAGAIATPALQSALAQIAANEAQHLSVFGRRAGGAAFQDAFPAPMSIEDASNALGTYTS